MQITLRVTAALLLGAAIWLHGVWKGRQDVIPYQIELRESLVRARFCATLGKDCRAVIRPIL